MLDIIDKDILDLVALFTRAWIEIENLYKLYKVCIVALFTRAWIEISRAYRRKQSNFVALFTRAWIEICC